MPILWLGFGICVGIAIGYIMRAAVDPSIEAQNRELRAAIARVRSALLLGNLRWAQRECESALGEEVA